MDKYTLAKYGAFWTSLKDNKMLGIGLNAVVIVGTAFAADRILDILQERGKPKKSRKYFMKMLENFPELKGKDPKLIARFWESLYHFSPHMAKDPLAAGAFILQNIERGFLDNYGGPPPDTYQALSDIQDKYDKNKGKKLFLPEAVKQLNNLGRVVSDPQKMDLKFIT